MKEADIAAREMGDSKIRGVHVNRSINVCSLMAGLICSGRCASLEDDGPQPDRQKGLCIWCAAGELGTRTIELGLSEESERYQNSVNNDYFINIDLLLPKRPDSERENYTEEMIQEVLSASNRYRFKQQSIS